MTNKIAHKIANILIISPYFYPYVEWGGPVTVTWNLAKLLGRTGKSVTVLTTDVSHDRKTRSISKFVNGVKVVYAKSLFNKLAWNFRLFVSLDEVAWGLKLVPKFDVVHFQDIFVLQNFLLSIVCRIYKIPYIITPHGNLDFRTERGKSVLKKIYYICCGRFYLENSSKIITVSEDEKRYIDSNFPSLARKTVIVSHLITIKKTGFIDIRSKYGISKNDLLIVFMGRIYSLKGVDELLDGFWEYLRIYKKSAILMFAGPDAGGLASLKQKINDSKLLQTKVIFTGVVTGDLKESILKNADIVSLLSKSEAIPTTLIEAAGYGKPVICSKECHLQNLILSGGGLLAGRNKVDVSKKIFMLSSTSKRSKIGEKARKWFSLNFNQEKILDRYEKIYEEAVSTK